MENITQTSDNASLFEPFPPIITNPCRLFRNDIVIRLIIKVNATTPPTCSPQNRLQTLLSFWQEVYAVN